MKILRTLFGLAFGLVFAGGGVMIARETALPNYQAWQAMQQWQAASAVLLEVSGSDNDTRARYRYSIDGADYQGSRVYVAPFKDNIGSYHKDLFARLKFLQENGQRVPIWYDPNDPAEAVIDRDMRWGLFALASGFCAFFILIGLGVCYAALRYDDSADTSKAPSPYKLWRQWKRLDARKKGGVRFVDYLAQLKEQSDKSVEPVAEMEQRQTRKDSVWLTKKEWRRNRIRSTAKSSLYGIWIFAVLWNAFCGPFLFFVVKDELSKGNYAVLLGLLLPLAGLFLLVKAWRMTREWLRFGVIELEMDPFPGSIGGHVGGSLHLSGQTDFRASYKVALECVQVYYSGSTNRSRSRRENVIWAERGTAEINAAGRGIRLDFRFDVPEQLPESDIEQTGEHTFWRLKLSTDSGDAGLNREYRIPVFHTRERSRYIDHDNSAQAEELRKDQATISRAAVQRGDFDATALSHAFVYRNRGNRHDFYYPMFRNKLLTLFALVFAAGFDFATFMINREFASSSGLASAALLIFSLPFGLVGLIATIATVYLPLNNLSVKLENGTVTVLRRLLFIPVLYHKLARNDVLRIEVKSSGSTGQGVDKIEHFRLVLHGRQGQNFTIAENIDGESLAGQLKEFIEQRLGKI